MRSDHPYWLGRLLSGGGDLNRLLAQNKNVVASARTGRTNRRIQASLLDLEKPIISKVRGPAIGLACSLALYCDFVYATPDATFADPHVSVGLVGGDGGAALWAQLTGYARARRYLLTGDPIRGDEAAEIGLITGSVPDDQLDQVVDAMARRLLSGANYAIKWTKAPIGKAMNAHRL